MENELSYVCGISSEPLLYRTVSDVLDRAAMLWPEREAIVVRHQAWRRSWRQLNDEVDRFARGLAACGLVPGDRVGIWSPNNREWVLAQFATARLGLILVTINPAYRASELAFALREAGCRMLLFAGSYKNCDHAEMVRALVPGNAGSSGARLASDQFPMLEFLVQIGAPPAPDFLPFDALYDAGENSPNECVAAIARSLDADQSVNIQFTSGTTGVPKGVTLSHFNIVNNAYFVGEAMKLSPGDRLCIPVPLYHCFGMVLGVLAAVTHGTTMVFPSESFEPEAVLATVAEERCTALHGVPTMFIAELEHPHFSRFDLSSLRTGIMAGAPCPVAVMRRVIAEMHMREVTICYGMTETSPVSFQSGTEDAVEKRVATVGRVHPHVQVKIVDGEGRVARRGTAGELLTRGYSVMRGYWNDLEKTAEVIDEAGWMHTGDLAVIDAEGYCRIVGRLKDMIIRGGENIAPREIEEFLYRHPKILDVAVVGVPDVRYGEEVCAVVRLREGEQATAEEIIAFCMGQIAHYKVPRYVYFTQSFPMTATGKVQKFILRKQMDQAPGLCASQTA